MDNVMDVDKARIFQWFLDCLPEKEGNCHADLQG